MHNSTFQEIQNTCDHSETKLLQFSVTSLKWPAGTKMLHSLMMLLQGPGTSPFQHLLLLRYHSTWLLALGCSQSERKNINNKNNQVFACEDLLCRSSTDQTRIIAATGVNKAWRTVGGEKVPSRWLSTCHRRKVTSSPPANISTAPHTTNYNRSEIKCGQWQRHGCTCSEEHVKNDTVLVSRWGETRARGHRKWQQRRGKKEIKENWRRTMSHNTQRYTFIAFLTTHVHLVRKTWCCVEWVAVN